MKNDKKEKDNCYWERLERLGFTILLKRIRDYLIATFKINHDFPN